LDCNGRAQALAGDGAPEGVAAAEVFMVSVFLLVTLE
jgi:hypothetical protein